MAPYGFLLLFITSIVGGLARWPLLALGAYVLTYYGHPPSRWWGAVLPDLRWALVAAIVAVLAAMRHRSLSAPDKPWFRDTIVAGIVLFVAWMWIQTPWAAAYGAHIEGVTFMTKYLLVLFVLIKLLDTPEKVDFMFVAHIVGCAYLGLLALERGSGSERLDGVGGPGIDDANSLGMQLATGIIFGAVQVLSGPIWKRGLVLLCMPFVLNGLVLTQSRGAFLGLITGGVILFLFAPTGARRRIGAMGALGVVLLLLVAHEGFWERMGTIRSEGQQRDQSAESRFVIINSQFQMFADHPLGVGHRGTAALSPKYIPREYLAKDEGVAEEDRERSSHNMFMSILVEQGVLGVAIYLCLLVAAAKRVLALRKAAQEKSEHAYVSLLGVGAGAALVTVLVAGQFADYLRSEILIWIYGILIAISRIREAVAVESAPPVARPQLQSRFARPQLHEKHT